MNEVVHHRLIYLNVCSAASGLFRIRKYGLAGEGASPGVRFEASRGRVIPVRSLSGACGSDVKLSVTVQHHACLPDIMFPTVMIIDESSETVIRPTIKLYLL